MPRTKCEKCASNTLCYCLFSSDPHKEGFRLGKYYCEACLTPTKAVKCEYCKKLTKNIRLLYGSRIFLCRPCQKIPLDIMKGRVFPNAEYGN